MNEQIWDGERRIDEVGPSPTVFETEYAALHNQRINLIRSYNMWYSFGFAVSLSSFWLLIHFSLSVSSAPLMIAAGIIASLIVLFAYRVVTNIDRDVVALYPRIIFLELVMDMDFYRDFLRRRPRGETERSFIEKSEKIEATTTTDLWRKVYAEFNARDFPHSRRLTKHFRLAAILCIIMYWVVIGVILLPQYFTAAA